MTSNIVADFSSVITLRYIARGPHTWTDKGEWFLAQTLDLIQYEYAAFVLTYSLFFNHTINKRISY